jgi:SAM-dependent methyltransferase
MIGLPGESPKTMQETIDFAKKTDPHTANFHMVMPFPSTELYDMLKRSGRFLKTTDDGTESGYNYPEAFYEIGDLKKEDIERYYKKAYREFYFRPKKIIGTLFDIRSLEELLWVFKTGWLVVMSLFRKRAASLKSRFRLPRKGHYSRGWGDAELDLLARLVYHPLYGLFYRHRYRMVFSWVPESTSLLEVGCGYGLFLPSLGKKTKRLYAMDIHPHLARVRDVMKKEGVGQIFLSRGDMVRLPYADESFDTIVCMSVLEHITPIDGAAEELARVLKKGGRLIAAFPTKNAVTRILFRLVNRKDDEIHPNSHASILEALSRRLSFQRKKVFPAFLPVDLGLYCIGEYVK